MEGYEQAARAKEFRLFPPAFRRKLERPKIAAGARTRVIVDLIAGLTEPSAEEIYRRMGGVVSGSLLHPAGRIT